MIKSIANIIVTLPSDIWMYQLERRPLRFDTFFYCCVVGVVDGPRLAAGPQDLDVTDQVLPLPDDVSCQAVGRNEG